MNILYDRTFNITIRVIFISFFIFCSIRLVIDNFTEYEKKIKSVHRHTHIITLDSNSVSNTVLRKIDKVEYEQQ